MVTGADAYSDEYVANLMKHDAQVTSIQHKAIGLDAFRAQRPVGAGPKPNLRFLRNLLKETDSHNSILLEQEQREAREKQRRLNRAEGKRSTGRDQVLNRFHDYEESQKKRRDEGHQVIVEDEQPSRMRRSRTRSRSPRRTESRDDRRHRDDARRRSKDEHDRTHHRHRRHRERDDGDTEDRSRRRADEGDERRRHRHRHHRSRSRSTEQHSSVKRKRHDSDDDERARTKHSRIPERERTIKGSALSRDESTSNRREKQDAEMRLENLEVPLRRTANNDRPSRDISSARLQPQSPSGSDSDPLADIIGPAPPPPVPEVRRRGRGAFASGSAMDSRFSSNYDPTVDVQPDSAEEDDWEQALEAMRDRQKWKQQGADRLLAAGFSEKEVKKWEKGDAKDESDVKWAKLGEGREWDRGKVVDEDGMVELKPEWGRLT